MTDATGQLFADLEVLEVLDPHASMTCRRATATAGRLVAQMGGAVWTLGDDDLGLDRALTLDKRPATDAMVEDPVGWAADDPRRIVLTAAVRGHDGGSDLAGVGANVVSVVAGAGDNEATLFASSGLADLLGDPTSAPLVPHGEWAAGTVAYAVLGAVASLQALAVRGATDVAVVDCVDALRWVNWKAPAMASVGAPVTREGAAAEWPVLRCADGFVALVYTPRDWKAIGELVDEDRLREDRFRRYADRQANRAEYVSVIAEWAADKTKAELDELMYRATIPGAAVATPQDLLDDPTLVHRGVFVPHDVEGVEVPVPVAPVRV